MPRALNTFSPPSLTERSAAPQAQFYVEHLGTRWCVTARRWPCWQGQFWCSPCSLARQSRSCLGRAHSARRLALCTRCPNFPPVGAHRRLVPAPHCHPDRTRSCTHPRLQGALPRSADLGKHGPGRRGGAAAAGLGGAHRRGAGPERLCPIEGGGDHPVQRPCLVPKRRHQLPCGSLPGQSFAVRQPCYGCLCRCCVSPSCLRRRRTAVPLLMHPAAPRLGRTMQVRYVDGCLRFSGVQRFAIGAQGCAVNPFMGWYVRTTASAPLGAGEAGVQ